MKLQKSFFQVALFSMLCFGVFFLLSGPALAQSDVYSMQLGKIRVNMLSEGQSEGNPDVLIGVSEEDLERFAPLGKYPSAVAVYLLRTEDGLVLVDTGFGRNFAKNFKSLGVRNADIRKVLITHSHRDHVGGLLKDGKPAFPNAKIYISKVEYDWSESVRQVLAAYKGKVELIEPGTFGQPGREVAKGVRPIAAYGHTPGHTMFLVESGKERMLIWGDLVNAVAFQVPRPTISATYDANPEQAAMVRQAVFSHVAENGYWVAGMHVPFPGIGKLVSDPENARGYLFIPHKKR